MDLSSKKQKSILYAYILSAILFFTFAIGAIKENPYISICGAFVLLIYILFNNFEKSSILLISLTPNGMILFIPGNGIRLIGLFYFMALVLYIAKKGIRPNFRYIIPYLGIFLICIFKLSTDRNIHDVLLITEIFFVIYFFVMILNKKDKVLDRHLYHAFIFGIVLMSIGMLLNKIVYGGSRMMALFDDSNYTSVPFALLFAISTFFIFNRKNVVYNLILLFFSLIMGFLTGSRAFVLSLGIVVLSYFIMSFKYKLARKIVFSYIALFMILILLYFLGIPSIVKLYDVIIERTLSLLNNHHDGEFMDVTSGRAFLWKYYLTQLFSSIKSACFGIGFSTYYLVENGGYGLVAHNSFVSGLMGFGIVGTVLILYTYCYFLKKYFVVKKREKRKIISLTLLVPILIGYFFLDGLLDIRLLLYLSMCIMVKRKCMNFYYIKETIPEQIVYSGNQVYAS